MKLEVKSIPERFRRAGMNFTRQAVTIDADDATAARLKGEPMLVVKEIWPKQEAETEAKEKRSGRTES